MFTFLPKEIFIIPMKPWFESSFNISLCYTSKHLLSWNMLIIFYLTAGRISKAATTGSSERNDKPEAWCSEVSHLPRLGILTHGGLIVHGELWGIVIDVQDCDGHVASSYLRRIL